MKLTKILSLSAVFIFVSLLQCNGSASETDGGYVLYPSVSGAPGPVAFSHRLHGLRGAGYACSRCHNKAASTPELSVSMNAIRQGQVCGDCHNGKTKGPHGQQIAAAVEDCSACHMPVSDIVISLNRMDPVHFSHIKHLAIDPGKKIAKTIGFSCKDCHPAPFDRTSKEPIGMKVPHESGGCAQCHSGRRNGGMRTAFAATTRCLACHQPVVENSQR
jgi:c(7)-type cytochrome triheme protein